MKSASLILCVIFRSVLNIEFLSEFAISELESKFSPLHDTDESHDADFTFDEIVTRKG
jgi:hypothetical protein